MNIDYERIADYIHFYNFERIQLKTKLAPFEQRCQFTYLQALLGHASLDMVQYYAQMVDEDLLQSHKAHSPVDNLARL